MEYYKYIVFEYDEYYPKGGLGDIKKSFDSLEEAKEQKKASNYDYSDIIDRDTWEEIE